MDLAWQGSDSTLAGVRILHILSIPLRSMHGIFCAPCGVIERYVQGQWFGIGFGPDSYGLSKLGAWKQVPIETFFIDSRSAAFLQAYTRASRNDWVILWLSHGGRFSKVSIPKMKKKRPTRLVMCLGGMFHSLGRPSFPCASQLCSIL